MGIVSAGKGRVKGSGEGFVSANVSAVCPSKAIPIVARTTLHTDSSINVYRANVNANTAPVSHYACALNVYDVMQLLPCFQKVRKDEPMNIYSFCPFHRSALYDRSLNLASHTLRR